MSNNKNAFFSKLALFFILVGVMFTVLNYEQKIVHGEKLANTPWPMYLGDSQRSGSSTFLGAIEPQTVQKRWEIEPMIGELHESLLFGFATLHAFSNHALENSAYVYSFTTIRDPLAVCAICEREKWRWRINGEYITNAPTLDINGVLHFATRNVNDTKGNFYAMYSSSATYWKYPTPSYVSGSPLLDQIGNVYFGDQEGTFTALDKRGTLLWEFKAHGAIKYSPMQNNNLIYFVTEDEEYNNTLYTINTDGELQSENKIEKGITTSISLEDDTIYAGIKNKVYAISVNDGKTIWNKDVTGRILSSITIGPNSLYVTTDANKLFSLTKKGIINWTLDINGDLAAPPVVDNADIVFIGDASKKVYRINGTNGEIEWTQKVPGKVVTNIVIDADGTLYGGTDTGGIVAIADKETHENIENTISDKIKEQGKAPWWVTPLAIVVAIFLLITLVFWVVTHFFFLFD